MKFLSKNKSYLGLLSLLITFSVQIGINDKSEVLAEKESLKDIKELPNSSKLIVEELYKEGILSGYADGTFKPNEKITRAEFAAILVRAIGFKNTGKNIEFFDSNKNEWHYNALNIMQQHGLINGKQIKENNVLVLAPNDKITRLEMALLLNRIEEKMIEVETNDFYSEKYLDYAYRDGYKVPDWAKKDLTRAIERGLFSGTGKNTLETKKEGTRLEAAIFAKRVKDKKDFYDSLKEQVKEEFKDKELSKEFKIIKDEYNKVSVGTISNSSEHNKINGYGLIFQNQNNSYKVIFKGQFKDNKPNGEGVFYSKSLGDSMIYKGSFENGLEKGTGKIYVKDDSNESNLFFEGDWERKYPKVGKMNIPESLNEEMKKVLSKDRKIKSYYGVFEYYRIEYGTATFVDGTKYVGSFREDLKFEGQGMLFDANGKKIFEGNFVSDKKNGFGKTYNPDGTVKEEGFYINDKLQSF